MEKTEVSEKVENRVLKCELKIFSLTILIERNGRKFGCLSSSEFRICSGARFRIVEKMLLSNEEPCFFRDLKLSGLGFELVY